jgi:hypothetical protein
MHTTGKVFYLKVLVSPKQALLGSNKQHKKWAVTVRTRISTSITIGPSLTGRRGTQLTGSIIYTLVTPILSPSSRIFVELTLITANKS